MGTLKELSEDILIEKTTKIIPENIKKDIQIFDITGTYEGSGGGSGEVKKFTSKEEMNSSTGNKQGDLAIVYGTEMTPWKPGMESNHFMFADTITLKNPIGYDYISIYFDSIDGTEYGSMNFTGYDNYIEFGETRIEYETSDYQTFTRKSGSVSELTTSSSFLYTESSAMGYDWLIKQLISADCIAFNGLYEYRWVEHPEYVCIPTFQEIGELPTASEQFTDLDINNYNSANKFETEKIVSLVDKIFDEVYSSYTSLKHDLNIYIDEDGDLCATCMIYKGSNNVYYNIGITNTFDNTTHLPTNQGYMRNSCLWFFSKYSSLQCI